MKNTIRENTDEKYRKLKRNMKNKELIQMQFDFKRNGSDMGPLLFSHPADVITTRDPSEVSACFQQIDQAVEAGYYAAGYISYEALPVSSDTSISNELPLLVFGIFREPADSLERTQPGSFHIGEWQMMTSKAAYEADFMKIQQAIQRCETTEINYTVPFKADFTGDARSYYQQLRKAQRSDYCAYLSFEDFDILSASPELFFQMNQGDITVRPMKGTIHRGLTYEDDLRQREWLQTSEKNKHENRLILELMKEELKQVTNPGSVHIINPYRVETYPTVYQMTSGLTGTIQEDRSVMDVMRALFPCGSIAGVPKTAGLKLIRELEDTPREIYCGAIGYITPDKEAVFNVPIRTVWVNHQKHTAHYGAGGAITSKSNLEEEYQEVQTKTNVLTWKQPEFELLETIRLCDGSYFLLQEHLQRLRQSAAYFTISLNMKDVQDQLEQVRIQHISGSWRVRLTVEQDGTCVAKSSPLTETGDVHTARLAANPIQQPDCYFFHKTTHRTHYTQHKHENEDVFDILLWNADGEITEFTIGNVVAEIDGNYYTPPISSGILPGTFRSYLLKKGVIRERRLIKKDINSCDRLWLINSLRKWVEIELL